MTAKTETPSRVLCQLHPNVDYKHAWGCPECVAELRKQVTQLREVAGRLAKALHGAEVLADCYAEMNCDPQAFRDNNDNYMAILDALKEYDALAKLSDKFKCASCGSDFNAQERAAIRRDGYCPDCGKSLSDGGKG